MEVFGFWNRAASKDFIGTPNFQFRVGLGKRAMNAGRQNAMGVRPRFSIAESRAFFRILSKTGDFREAAARFEEQTGKKPPVSEATGNDFLARALRRGN